jgi:catechol 2,3-dioxygenase-like lactoylglutathione lyase family enzyme
MQDPAPATIDMALEVVTLAVADVDRAKAFYLGLGWRLDADIVAGDAFRVVQVTPLHSQCSVSFGKGVTTAEPGSAQRLLLVVRDIAAARADLVSRGVDVSEVFHLDGGPVPGPDPEGRSYMSLATFSDPDGNGWQLQEITERLPGRVWDD